MKPKDPDNPFSDDEEEQPFLSGSGLGAKPFNPLNPFPDDDDDEEEQPFLSVSGLNTVPMKGVLR